MFWSLNTLVLLLTAVILLYKYLYRHFNYWEVRKVPFIKPQPIFGNYLALVAMKKTIGEYLADFYTDMKHPFFGIYVFNKPCLIVKSPELIKSMLVKDFNYFSDRSIASCKHEPLTDNMLFLSKNPDWKMMRRMMTPVFTSGKLKSMFPLMDNIGFELEKYLTVHEQELLETKEVCSRFSTDVIAKCAFAINAHSFDCDNPDFRRHGRSVFDFTLRNAFNQTSFFFLPSLVQFFKLNFMKKEAQRFFIDVFEKTLASREDSGVKGNDLVDCLIELTKDKEFVETYNFRDEKVVAQATQFFIAGFETSSSTMAFTLYELCMQPQIQHRLRQEITTTIKNNKGLTYEAVMEMKYLHMVVCETLRKYPVLPFLDRVANQDYKIPETDIVIEKGTPVYIPMFGLHYDPEYFPDPHKYDPERFSDDSISALKSFSYIPFGEGPRNCIGERFGMLSTKIGLAHILSRFELIKTDQLPSKMEFEPMSFVLAAKGGLPMRFKRINTQAA